MSRCLPSPFSFTRSPIGIDVGDDMVRILQTDIRSGAIKAMAALPLPSRDEVRSFADLLKHAFREGGFLGRRCMLSAPLGSFHVESVVAPKSCPEELKRALAWKASERFGLPECRMEVDWIHTGMMSAGPRSPETAVLLFAFEHAPCIHWLDSVMLAGCTPIALEPGFCAAARTHSRRYRRVRDREHSRVLLHAGSDGHALLFLRGDQIVNCSIFSPRGPETVPEWIEGCLGPCCTTLPGRNPRQFICSGSGAARSELARMIGDVLGTPVSLDDELGSVQALGTAMEQRGIVDDDPSAWTAVMGLALRPTRARKAYQYRGRAA
ncbi:MAG: hypothetical protein VXX30_02700 [Planctomycetota bacterium]|nr:hypothetical protein [Planctomycetota bacterium]